jgi:hypothetical protein
MGADGLCNGEEQCGCGLDNLMPCDDLNWGDCEAAKFVNPPEGDPKYDPECPEGYYEPVEACDM